jgi:hypothetical protein
MARHRTGHPEPPGTAPEHYTGNAESHWAIIA